MSKKTALNKGFSSPSSSSSSPQAKRSKSSSELSSSSRAATTATYNPRPVKKQVTMCFIQVTNYQDVVDRNEPHVVASIINELSTNLMSVLETDNHGYIVQREAASVFCRVECTDPARATPVLGSACCI